MDDRRVYSNIVEVESNLFDFILKFGNRDRIQAQKGEYDPVVSVFLSPQHAKLLATILANHVEMYERNFGPLPAIELQPKAHDSTKQ